MDYEKDIIKKWIEEKRHIAKSYGDKKYFITAAFPYPNSPQHIGHARTYTITDIMARFHKLLGYSVLFPMGFHVTGTPIVAMADRIKENDKELFEIFEKIYGIRKEVYMKLTDPRDLIMFFANEIEEGMIMMGYMIDWTRKFYTSDPYFEKFIEWQMKKLYDKGFLIKDKHPIPYSPKLNSSVGAHDTKGDVDPEIEEYTGIMFKTNIGYLIAATLRPETIYGITNIWIRADEKYIKIKLQDEIFIIALKAWNKLKYQFNNYEELDVIEGSSLLNLKAHVPILDLEVPIFHGNIVNPEEGTGIVMSVPAHSVYDYHEYRNISENYPIIIKVGEELSDAKKFYKKDLEAANKELYRIEFNNGFHIPLNTTVKQARELVRSKLEELNKAIKIYKIANGPIYSRAGDEVVVKIIDNQWFIDYSNDKWKALAKECLSSMKIIPEDFRSRFLNTIEWLDKKACTRTRGLGTRFLFDKNQIVESLSDSTIYMLFYLMVPYIKNYDLEKLNESFFDYIVYGIGEPIDQLHEKIRKEFLYWYGVDARHSGVDLIANHLTFFIFNHVAIFEKDKWPKAIVTNGSVLMDGKKMSKSLGNIIPLKKAISNYGADTIRLAVAAGSDIKSDTNFSEATAKGIVERLNKYVKLFKSEHRESNIDEWIRFKLYSKYKKVKEMYLNYDIKGVVDQIFYEFYNHLEWGIIRGMVGVPRDVVKRWNIVMFPIIPITTDYLHREIFGKSVYDELLEDIEYNTNYHPEDLFKQIVEDLKNLRNIKEFKRIKIGVAKRWKFEVYKALSQKRDINYILSSFPQAKELISKLKGRAYSLEFYYDYEEIIKYLEQNKKWLEQYFNIDVEIGEEEIKYALPDKPEFIV